MLATVRKDIAAVRERDPAVGGVLEILLCYPGFHALQLHRIAHFLYKQKLRLLARLLSHITRFLTGVEIHPGAQIGSGVFIDHGMGVVIGETTIIKDNVTLYQGVTLGGTGKEKGKRHPTIEKNVVVASGAKVLGSFCVGENARIGAGAVVLQSVPDNCTVVGVPGRIVVQQGKRVDRLNHHQLPDPLQRCMENICEEVDQLQQQLAELQTELEQVKRAKVSQECGKLKIV